MQVEAQGPSRARFGAFELELPAGELRRAGVLLHLSPQPFNILVLLLHRPGQLVSREEIRQQIWGAETFVDFEHGLNFAIKKIRDTLGDDANTPRYIETLPRRGYRFVCPVEWIDHSEAPVGLGETTDTRPKKRGSEEIAPDPLQVSPQRRSLPRFLFAFIPLLLTAALFAIVSDRARDRFAAILHLPLVGTPPHFASIAVLPLESLSSDPQQEYFADGLTDTLITDLGQIGTMRVISRTSVIQYKRGKSPLPQIAHDLNVDAVVEGTILRSGSKVRISVQLLDARQDRHLWADTFERDPRDIISLERQVALAIAHEISGRLTTAAEMRLRAPASVNPDAFDAYLRGSYLLAERTPEAETSARGYFEQALRADPSFAPAYSGLALFYSVVWGLAPDFPRAEQYARKAIALDPDLAEGHAALGFAQLNQHRYTEAERELKLAIALNPNYALVHHLYSDYWLFMGRPTEALAENDKALQLDPFSFPNNFMRSGILYFLGQYDAALDQVQTVTALNRKAADFEDWRLYLDWLAGKVPEALAEERAMGTSTQSDRLLHETQEVAAIYAKAGLRAALVREAASRVRDRSRRPRLAGELPGVYGAKSIACLYALLGDRETTLHWLQEALKEDLGPEQLMCSREYDFLRADPRYQQMQRQLGLPIGTNP